MNFPGAAHGEDGALIPAVEFDFAAVDRDLGEDASEDLSQFSQEDIDRALAVLRMLLSWIWQNGMKNTEGLTIRTIIVCWVFLKELRPLELSQLARGFGKHKQSIGRWHDQFKRDFSAIKTPHMRAPK